MQSIRALILLLCLVPAASAKTKEFTILGHEKIKAEVQRGMPLPAEQGGIKIEAAAFMVGDGKLTFAFGFTTKKKLQHVRVEEVSGPAAVEMVDDPAPRVEKDFWKGEAAPLPLTKAGVPWVYERGDTTKIFRFTVRLEGSADPIVLYQPAIYPGSSKKVLQQMAP